MMSSVQTGLKKLFWCKLKKLSCDCTGVAMTGLIPKHLYLVEITCADRHLGYIII